MTEEKFDTTRPTVQSVIPSVHFFATSEVQVMSLFSFVLIQRTDIDTNKSMSSNELVHPFYSSLASCH